MRRHQIIGDGFWRAQFGGNLGEAFLAKLIELGAGGFELFLEVERLWSFLAAGDFGEVPRLLAAGEDAVQGVIVLGRDWIELVIVAAGAADGKAHEPAADQVQAIESRPRTITPCT